MKSHGLHVPGLPSCSCSCSLSEVPCGGTLASSVVAASATGESAMSKITVSSGSALGTKAISRPSSPCTLASLRSNAASAGCSVTVVAGLVLDGLVISSKRGVGEVLFFGDAE